jgi:serine/threonine-protein kinase
VQGGYHGRYLPSGHLVYIREGTLFAAAFDLDRLEVTGEAVPVLEGVMSSSGFAGAQFAHSDGGALVYLPGGSVDAEFSIHWMDSAGKTEPLRDVPSAYGDLRFSPDGRRLAVDLRDGSQSDVWVYEWGRDTFSRLTFDPGEDTMPVWTPDGRRIAFASRRADKGTTNLYWQWADGTGDAERLTESKNMQYPASWHPSGKFLAFTEFSPQTSTFDVMILPIEGSEASGWKPGEPTVFLNAPFIENHPEFSPDGRWLAYESNESGRVEVYVRPFPGPGGKWQVSTDGGHPRYGLGPVASSSTPR